MFPVNADRRITLMTDLILAIGIGIAMMPGKNAIAIVIRRKLINSLPS
jgi:hypothetical protein